MSPSVPIIPPYEPETGITQSPDRSFQRRPRMGKLSDEEARIEAAYLPMALMIVKSMWANYAVENIALVIRVKTGWKAADSRLVYALKRRLDRGQG